MKEFSVIVPIFNEDKYIKELLESIFQINYPADKFEVIVVNDASTDNTVKVIKTFPQVRLIDLQVNVGRYAARKTGAEAAKYPYLLFVDSRALVDPNILAVLDQLNEKIVIGRVLNVEKPGLFDTFYIAIRRIVFRRYFALIANPIRLTKNNFDLFPKGTTVLYVQKETLFKAYEVLNNVEIGKDSSDDIRLINTIVQFTDALIHPDVKITGLSRTSFHASVLHLIWRGGTFADYYFHPAKRNFWLVIVLPLLAILGILAGTIFIPIMAWIKFAALAGLDLIITLLLARTFREFVVILFMLPICVAVFYTGIIRGMYLKGHQSPMTQ
jgi:glycosyltransferase involved in cell wall biosynthesis